MSGPRRKIGEDNGFSFSFIVFTRFCDATFRIQRDASLTPIETP